ncbi:FAD-dependent monooxygenase [Virgibacillus halodenitrificans]|uniref:FAD-dependent monooxygenase n=1 Tax=Virgibacillus halodenitrificans TaxID=1482 RepID=A0ABR7VQK2_VIRHA|nr:NAD(P)/FAD-dependent oxidoreductase [Virgibacillus halodenitrificans]MBD1224036.1 FAD-dependent monooxygenase [Virgibacillus halodenitrificans]
MEGSFVIKAHLHNNSLKGKGTAVVVGASLSGLMTGIALAREGLHVTILERASEGRPGGAGLQVDGARFGQSKTEKLLRNLASQGKSTVQLWTTIESRLREEAKSTAGIELHYNTRVEEVGQDTHSAWAITDQEETVHGDILVGADGHHSMVRRFVAPHRPDATFAGYMVWMASMNEEDLPEEQRPSYHEPKVRMLDSRNGFLFGSIIDREDGTGNRRVGCTWYDNSRNDLLRHLGCVEGDVVLHSLRGKDVPEQTLTELNDQATKRWDEPFATVLRHATATRTLIGIPIKEYVPDQLIKGRVALVGDAAHVPAPITASGFNQSLIDAATLGSCVAGGLDGEAAVEALKAYEAERLKKVRRMVQSGQSYSQSFGRA